MYTCSITGAMNLRKKELLEKCSLPINNRYLDYYGWLSVCYIGTSKVMTWNENNKIYHLLRPYS